MPNPASLPLVTIVTPAHNRAALLEQAIESVLAQDYPAIEHIIVDDGSTDSTPEVLKRYRHVIAVSHPNCGEQRTVNRGWGMATGKFICTLNDDDILLPGAVREAVAAFQQRPDVLVFYPDFQIIDDSSRVLRNVVVREFDFVEMLRRVDCLPGPGAFVRRAAIERVGARDVRFTLVADCEHWFRVSLAGPMARLPLTLAAHRVHDGSTTLRYPEPMMDELRRLVDHLFNALPLPPELKGFQREALSNVLATMAAIRHQSSYVASLAGFCHSFAVHPMAWFHWPPMHLARVAARMALPYRVLMPMVTFCRRARAGAAGRRGAAPLTAAQSSSLAPP
jgi:glycosyltransferase involved in cell wall biosynthesis